MGATGGPRATIAALQAGKLTAVQKYSPLGRRRGRNTPGWGLAGAEILGVWPLPVHSCGSFRGPGEGNAAWR